MRERVVATAAADSSTKKASSVVPERIVNLRWFTVRKY
jgi:hypothetical protein